MPDREKVIKGLEICSYPGSCRSECPYYEKEGAACSYWLLKDALELLKGQEPVKPDYSPYYQEWYCGNCGKTITRAYDFCNHCGRKVEWDA